MIKLTAVEPKDGYQLSLRFSDGASGVYDFTAFIEANTEMTAPLRDSAFPLARTIAAPQLVSFLHARDVQRAQKKSESRPDIFFAAQKGVGNDLDHFDATFLESRSAVVSEWMRQKPMCLGQRIRNCSWEVSHLVGTRADTSFSPRQTCFLR